MPRRCRDPEVLEALRRSVEHRGRMPTEKELCDDIKIARGQLDRNIQRLVRHGKIRKLPRGTMRIEFTVQA